MSRSLRGGFLGLMPEERLRFFLGRGLGFVLALGCTASVALGDTSFVGVGLVAASVFLLGVAPPGGGAVPGVASAGAVLVGSAGASAVGDAPSTGVGTLVGAAVVGGTATAGAVAGDGVVVLAAPAGANIDIPTASPPATTITSVTMTHVIRLLRRFDDPRASASAEKLASL